MRSLSSDASATPRSASSHPTSQWIAVPRNRATIALPAPQRRLLDEISSLGKPVVVLLSSGSAVSFDTSKVNAILQTWYYGQQGGNAIADAVLGQFSPAGRLPVTFYRDDADLPPFEDYAMQGRTYRYFEGKPLYAFGHGLRELDEVVQVYARRPQRGQHDPIRWLVGYQRAKALASGETRQLTITLADRWVALWSEPLQQRVIAPGQLIFSVGPAADQATTDYSVTLESRIH